MCASTSSSIMVASSILLFVMLASSSPPKRTAIKQIAAGILSMQVIYKFITPLTVHGGVPPGQCLNPVVLANLTIATFHLVTLVAIVGDAMIL